MSGPPSVSTHRNFPRRCALVSRRPTSAAAISPGACGRQTYVSRVVDRDDLAAEHAVELLPRPLGLGKLGHCYSLAIFRPKAIIAPPDTYSSTRRERRTNSRA